MPVVITDYTNATWAMEDPRDGLLHVGMAGMAGPRLEDVLDFIDKHRAKFDKFVETKRMDKIVPGGKQRTARGRAKNGLDAQI